MATFKGTSNRPWSRTYSENEQAEQSAVQIPVFNRQRNESGIFSASASSQEGFGALACGLGGFGFAESHQSFADRYIASPPPTSIGSSESLDSITERPEWSLWGSSKIGTIGDPANGNGGLSRSSVDWSISNWLACSSPSKKVNGFDTSLQFDFSPVASPFLPKEATNGDSDRKFNFGGTATVVGNSAQHFGGTSKAGNFRFSPLASPYVPSSSGRPLVTDLKKVTEELSPQEEEIVSRTAEKLATLALGPSERLETQQQHEESQAEIFQRHAYTDVQKTFEGILGPGVVPTGQDTVFARPDPRRKRGKLQQPYCVFCKQVTKYETEKTGGVFDETLDAQWKHHQIKNSSGDVICPYLYTHVCRFCGATKEKAHTDRYCPKRQQENFEKGSYRRR